MESKHEIPDITRKPFECDSDYEARLIRSFHSLEAALKEQANSSARIFDGVTAELRKTIEALQSQLAEARSQVEHAHVMWQGSARRCNLLQNLLDESRSQIEALTEQSNNRHERALSLARDVDHLEAQLADYGKPVTDEEWDQNFGYDRGDGSPQMMDRGDVDRIIASRTQSRQMSERSAGE